MRAMTKEEEKKEESLACIEKKQLQKGERATGRLTLLSVFKTDLGRIILGCGPQ